jgi:hypothetical protein
MATFGLVHGAGHGAWCWERLIPPANDLVLVGHSLAGLTVPLVAARRPVWRLVFLCALIPEFGRSLADQVAADPELYDLVLRTHPGRVTGPDGTVGFRDEAAARDVFYHDCTPEDVHWAFSRLRPQTAAPRREPCPLSAWAPGEKAYILCREDRAVSPAWSRRVARERLGVEPIELDGSHSPFISRPSALADILDRLAR